MLVAHRDDLSKQFKDTAERYKGEVSDIFRKELLQRMPEEVKSQVADVEKTITDMGNHTNEAIREVSELLKMMLEQRKKWKEELSLVRQTINKQGDELMLIKSDIMVQDEVIEKLTQRVQEVESRNPNR